MSDPARSYSQRADATARAPMDPQDAYDLYVEAYVQEARREFDAGGHEYVDFTEFLADGPPVKWNDFYAQWLSDQEELARELGWPGV